MPCEDSAGALSDDRYENYSNTSYRRLTITKKSVERKYRGVAARQSVPEPQFQCICYAGWNYVSGERKVRGNRGCDQMIGDGNTFGFKGLYRLF